MNEVQKAAMKVEPLEFPKPANANQGEMVNAAMRENHKKILSIITEGVGALKNATFEGHDALAVAELFQFLKNVTADLRQQIDGKIQPAATFSPAKPEGEKVAA